MPVKVCSSGGKPGFKYGDSGKCYTYTVGNAASRAKARALAEKQGRAMHVQKFIKETVVKGIRGLFKARDAQTFKKKGA